MSIIIRKKTTGEIFDMSPEFKLEIRNTSPIFNDLGSKTISTSLPKTPNNIKLLGFSHRLDIRNKPEIKIPVIVSSGSYVRNGVLFESSAYNSDNTFGITIAFDEGIMYEAMSNILLTELSNLPVIESTPEKLYSMMNELCTTNRPDDRLSVFQVKFKRQSYKDNDNGGIDAYWTEYVNGVKVEGGAKLSQRDKTVVIEDSKLVEISVPFGYGITPFVRVWYLLELVFRHFGYRIGSNPFKDDFQLNRLCVLNNTVDAIVNGTLDYKQLLPPVSINDFLNALYCRFGMKVSFDSNTNTVNLILIRDVFRTDNKMTPLSLSALPNIDYTEPKQLKLSVSKNLDDSDTEMDTYEEFLAKYNNTIGEIENMLIYVSVGGIYYDPRSGLFYQCSTINNEKKRLSSIHFDWNKKDEGLEVEEITSIDEALTMDHREDTSSAFLYFGLDHQLMNSILTINGANQNTDTQNVLAFAYDMGEAWIEMPNGSIFKYGYKYGSIFPYAWGSSNVLQKDADGNEYRYALTLTGEYGAFNNFFKEYDAFLRHSNHTVKLESFQSSYALSSIDFTEKRIVDNQPLLLDKFDHDLDGHSGQLCKIEARTLRLYEPHDLDKEQALPIPEDIKYQWVLYSNQRLNIKNERDKIYDNFPHSNINYYTFKSLDDGKIIEDPAPPGDRTYWFLPPTESQFTNKVKTGSRAHTCKVRYTLIYDYNSGSPLVPNWETKTERIERNIDYESWFEPELIE